MYRGELIVLFKSLTLLVSLHNGVSSPSICDKIHDHTTEIYIYKTFHPIHLVTTRDHCSDVPPYTGPPKGGGVPCYMLYGFSMGLLYAITKILTLL